MENNSKIVWQIYVHGFDFIKKMIENILNFGDEKNHNNVIKENEKNKQNEVKKLLPPDYLISLILDYWNSIVIVRRGCFVVYTDSTFAENKIKKIGKILSWIGDEQLGKSMSNILVKEIQTYNVFILPLEELKCLEI